MWDLPGPGIKPVSSALAGRFLTTAPPGKSLDGLLRFTNQMIYLKLLLILGKGEPFDDVISSPVSGVNENTLRM